MPNKTTIEQIHDVAGTLRSELLSAGAINDKDEIIKPQTFLDIIDHKESELSKFNHEVEDAAGVVTDKYAFDALNNYYLLLKQMKENMSMSPRNQTLGEEPATAERTTQKQPSKFGAGIKKFFVKLYGKKTIKEPTNTR